MIFKLPVSISVIEEKNESLSMQKLASSMAFLPQ